MEEFDESIPYSPAECRDCYDAECVNGMCNQLNWPDDEVIDEFIMQLYDEDLTLQVITDLYWSCLP
jgi:hypothetical protein